MKKEKSLKNIENLPHFQKLKIFLYFTDTTYTPLKIQPITKSDEAIQCNLREESSFFQEISNVLDDKKVDYNSLKLETNQNHISTSNNTSTKEKSIEEEKKNFLKKKRKNSSIPSSDKFLEKYLDDGDKQENDPIFNVSMRRGRGRPLKRGEEKKYPFNRHTKYSDDNIMKKIKCAIYESIRRWLNSSLSNEDNYFDSFLKIKKDIISNLKKDFNLKMIDNETIADMFSKEINEKYSHYKKIHNITLIEKILKSDNNNYDKVKIILGLKFKEVLQIFNGNIDDSVKNKFIINNENILENFDKISDLLVKIRKNEQKQNNYNKELTERYLKNISVLSSNYEDWFINKHKRSTK